MRRLVIGLVVLAMSLAACSVATVLRDGRVLLVSGPVAKVFDPATGTTTVIGTPVEARFANTATLLSDGRVLLVGGAGQDVGAVATAELFDPATGTFAATGSLAEARAMHSATLLNDGRVLVAGGGVLSLGGEEESPPPLATAELYDPASGTFTATGPMTTPRAMQAAVLLPDGRVVLVGGDEQATAEIYDPASGTFTASGSLSTVRVFHTASLLQDGRILVAAGQVGELNVGSGSSDEGGPVAATELFDPATGTSTEAAPLAEARAGHTATVLQDGRVLVVGGMGATDSAYLASAETYDPASGTWSPAASLNTARGFHTASLLQDGRVLVVGGDVFPTGEDVTDLITTAEVYDPAADSWMVLDLGTVTPPTSATPAP
jgi:hypothetical protein